MLLREEVIVDLKANTQLKLNLKPNMNPNLNLKSKIKSNNVSNISHSNIHFYY